MKAKKSQRDTNRKNQREACRDSSRKRSQRDTNRKNQREAEDPRDTDRKRDDR